MLEAGAVVIEAVRFYFGGAVAAEDRGTAVSRIGPDFPGSPTTIGRDGLRRL